MLAAIPEKKLLQPETNDQALKSATSWSNFNQISNKLSIGTVTTAKYHEKV